MLWHLPEAGQVRGRRMESIKQEGLWILAPAFPLVLGPGQNHFLPLSACDNELLVVSDGTPCPTSRSIKGIISDSLRHAGVHQLHSQLDPGLQ